MRRRGKRGRGGGGGAGPGGRGGGERREGDEGAGGRGRREQKDAAARGPRRAAGRAAPKRGALSSHQPARVWARRRRKVRMRRGMGICNPQARGARGSAHSKGRFEGV